MKRNYGYSFKKTYINIVIDGYCTQSELAAMSNIGFVEDTMHSYRTRLYVINSVGHVFDFTCHAIERRKC
jgi:hypothetical protein